MGLSSKKTTTTATQTVAPSAYSQPYIDDAAAQFKPAYEQSKGLLGGALSSVQGAMDGANKYYGDVTAGKYLNGNPHLDSVLAAANRDTRNQVGSIYEGAGRYGSAYHDDAVTRGILENEDRLRYGDYATERGYQNQAPGQNAQISASLAPLLVGLPQIPATSYADNVNGLLGKYVSGNSTGTSKTSGGFLGDLLLAAAASAAKVGSAGG